jgi:hypothetical protein
MNKNPDTNGAYGVLFGALIALSLAIPATAQEASKGPRPGEVETAPIKCWWKTDTTAIRIGERFTVTLTCGVIETASLKVVAGTNQLDPGAVQLTPFEVVSGVRRQDVVAPPWKYFQYEYRVRLLNEGFFGQDASLPALPVTYNIETAAGKGAQGRDQSYILPPLPVRVTSLVPKDANDIRDASIEGFEAIESRRFRSTSATVAGGILLGFSAVLLVLAGVRALGSVRQRRPDAVRAVAPLTALSACVRALSKLKSDAASGGWSPDLARRALTMVRVAGAAGLGRPIAQTTVSRNAKEREGQLLVRQGVLRPRYALISAATTAQTVGRALGNGHPPSASSRAALEQLRGALETFSVAAYGRNGEPDGIALDGALRESIDAVRQLRLRSVWPMGGVFAFRSPEPGLGTASMREESSRL